VPASSFALRRRFVLAAKDAVIGKPKDHPAAALRIQAMKLEREGHREEAIEHAKDRAAKRGIGSRPRRRRQVCLSRGR
jgi:hypothetical protein